MSEILGKKLFNMSCKLSTDPNLKANPSQTILACLFWLESNSLSASLRALRSHDLITIAPTLDWGFPARICSFFIQGPPSKLLCSVIVRQMDMGGRKQRWHKIHNAFCIKKDDDESSQLTRQGMGSQPSTFWVWSDENTLFLFVADRFRTNSSPKSLKCWSNREGEFAVLIRLIEKCYLSFARPPSPTATKMYYSRSCKSLHLE